MSNSVDEIKSLAAEYKSIIASAKPATTSNYFTHSKSGDVKLAKGANAKALTVDAENLLKAILAASGVFSTTYTSTLRTYDDQARILLQKTAAQVQSLGYYGGAADFITAFNKYKANNDRKGFAAYMQARDTKRGKAISNHIPGYALDIPRNTKVNAFLSKNGGSIKGFSKFLDEPKNNCTHIEFSFLVCGQSNSGGGGAIPADNAAPAAGGSISASVGKDGKNIKNDVIIIQTLLNKKGAKLAVDGDCGNATINAIASYQKSVMKSASPDGRVDVNGATWKSLSGGSTPAPIAAAPIVDVPAAPEAPAASQTPDAPAASEGSSEAAASEGGSDAAVGGGSEASAAPASISSTLSISDSVGKGGKNIAEDVKVIQSLLNKKGAKLAEDGLCGTGTINAIGSYQKSVMKIVSPDGRVDVNGATWKSLSDGSSAAAVANADTSGADIAAGAEAPSSSAPATPAAPSKNISDSVGKGAKNQSEDVKIVKTLLVDNWKYKLTIDDKADDALYAAISEFQKTTVGSSKPDARIDANGNTWKFLIGLRTPLVASGVQVSLAAPGKAPAKTPDSEYAAVARQYGLEVATLHAIKDVESRGEGYLADGRPKILFEGQWFWKLLQKAGIDPNKHTAGNQDILYPAYDKSKYKGGSAEYGRLERAMKINRTAALQSASWGEFQIMGFNHKEAGYADVESMVNDMQTSGPSNVKSLLRYCDSRNIIRYVNSANKNWAAFAEAYNGPKYKDNQYDTKLANAYAKYKKTYPN